MRTRLQTILQEREETLHSYTYLHIYGICTVMQENFRIHKLLIILDTRKGAKLHKTSSASGMPGYAVIRFSANRCRASVQTPAA